MAKLKLRMFAVFIVLLMEMFCLRGAYALTNPQDMFAINYLYQHLGTPPLPRWRLGGDPCLEGWHGVECVGSNIIELKLRHANLGGELRDALGMFTSIKTIDLGYNYIGGKIPGVLPVTLTKFILPGNQLGGTIPNSLSNLKLLTDIEFSNNQLEGKLPDAFESLTSLINLDLSDNKLSGQLPYSMRSLSSLKQLHIENNRLSGTLDVLQDLPLADLNIEHNQFSGHIPVKLLTIPNFRTNGNLFDADQIPPSSSPPALPPSVQIPLSWPPAHALMGPYSYYIPPIRHEQSSTARVIGYAAIAVGSFIVVALTIAFFILKWHKKKVKKVELPVQQEVEGNEGSKEPISNANLSLPDTDMETEVSQEEKSEEPMEYEIDMTGAGLMPTLAEKNVVKPIAPETIQLETAQDLKPETSVSSFTVASLQQYTNSFIVENLISKTKLGKAYLAKLPDGELLAVTNLDHLYAKVPADVFVDLVSSVSKLQHPNILELVGYCAEFDQCLLVYNYFSRVSLHDLLHNEDDLKKKLSWNARVEVALGAARALEYLHEGCRPPVVHQNFDSSKIILDSRLAVRVSECGLALLTAPETSGLEPSSYKSDVYSFGVVLLELLTGRKPYSCWRPREERDLVTWASSQLHDINALDRMADPSLDGKFPMRSLSSFADIISRCIQQEPEFRPLMSQVVLDLTRMTEERKTYYFLHERTDDILMNTC